MEVGNVSDFVLLAHPSGGEFLAAAEAVPGWKALGWREVPAAPAPKKGDS